MEKEKVKECKNEDGGKRKKDTEKDEGLKVIVRGGIKPKVQMEKAETEIE